MSEWVRARIPVQSAEAFQIQGSVPTQEDCFKLNPERGIYILADGFGGGPGKLAAELAVDSVRQFLEQEAGDLDATLPFELRPYYSLAGNVLFNAISFANQKVLQLNQDRPTLQSGGASLTAAYLEGNLIAFANVGANRVHLKRGSQIREIVAPKTLQRQISPFEESGPGDEVPLMSLGTSKNLEPEIIEIELKVGDRLFMQTSGVKETLREEIFVLNSSHGVSQRIDSVYSPSNASIIWLSF